MNPGFKFRSCTWTCSWSRRLHYKCYYQHWKMNSGTSRRPFVSQFYSTVVWSLMHGLQWRHYRSQCGGSPEHRWRTLQCQKKVLFEQSLVGYPMGLFLSHSSNLNQTNSVFTIVLHRENSWYYRYSPRWAWRARRGLKPTCCNLSVLPMKKLMTASATTQLENPLMTW